MALVVAASVDNGIAECVRTKWKKASEGMHRVSSHLFRGMISTRCEEIFSDTGGHKMSGTSPSHQNDAEAENATHDPQRHKVKQLAIKPVAPGLPREQDCGHFSDERTDRQLASQLVKVDSGETIPTPGSRAGSEDRDIHEEEWRAHDRNGPYGQGRRRKN